MEAGSAELELVAERVLPADRAAVFRAFTNADELAKWWGPEGFTIPHLDFPARKGESYRLEMQPPDGNPFYIKGAFQRVEPPESLVFTFVYEEPDPDDVEMVAELSFEDLGGSTLATLRQKPFKTEARVALHRDGWSDSFDKLEQVLRRKA